MGCSHSVLREATMTVREVVADFYRRMAEGRLDPGRRRQVELDEPYMSGETHRAMVDLYRNELRKHKHLVPEAAIDARDEATG